MYAIILIAWMTIVQAQWGPDLLRAVVESDLRMELWLYSELYSEQCNKANIKELKQLAEQGDAQAQYCLAYLYDSGSRELPKDKTLKVSWLQKASDAGHLSATYNLADCYENGDGIPQDFDKAMKLYLKVALNDYGRSKDFTRLSASAMFMLGKFYYLGRAVPKDYVKAYMWWHLAFSKDKLLPTTSIFEELAKKLSSKQIENSKKMADDWKRTTLTKSNSLKVKKKHQ